MKEKKEKETKVKAEKKATKPKKDTKVKAEKKKAIPKKETKKVEEKKEVKASKKVVKEEKKELKVTKKAKKPEEKKEPKIVKKVVKKEEKKEPLTVKEMVKEEKEEVLLPPKKQKGLRVISKIISVLAKVVRILAMIAVPILVLALIIIPIMFSHVKVDGNIIKFNEANIILSDNKITFKMGDETEVISDNVTNMDEIIAFFNDNSLGRIVTSVELSIAFSVANIIISIFVLSFIEKLFRNFSTQKTPFIEENCEYLHKIAKFMIYSLIVTFIAGVSAGLFGNDILGITSSSYGITEILITYVAYFIFIYATKMQDKNKTVIYD